MGEEVKVARATLFGIITERLDSLWCRLRAAHLYTTPHKTTTTTIQLLLFDFFLSNWPSYALYNQRNCWLTGGVWAA